MKEEESEDDEEKQEKLILIHLIIENKGKSQENSTQIQTSNKSRHGKCKSQEKKKREKKV